MMLATISTRSWWIGLSAAVASASADTPINLLIGRGIFVAVFALLGIWLFIIPASRLWGDAPPPPWYRNVRFWAVLVAAVQMTVYLLWA